MNVRLNQSGNTIIDAILGLVVGAIIMTLATSVLYSQSTAYEFVVSRTTATSDLNSFINKIRYQLEYVETADLVSISPVSMQFYDKEGDLQTYSFAGNVLRHNSEQVASDVQTFSLTYYNESGTALAPNAGSIASVRAIKVTAKTRQDMTGGQQLISTYIVPRAFLGYTLL